MLLSRASGWWALSRGSGPRSWDRRPISRDGWGGWTSTSSSSGPFGGTTKQGRGPSFSEWGGVFGSFSLMPSINTPQASSGGRPGELRAASTASNQARFSGAIGAGICRFGSTCACRHLAQRSSSFSFRWANAASVQPTEPRSSERTFPKASLSSPPVGGATGDAAVRRLGAGVVAAGRLGGAAAASGAWGPASGGRIGSSSGVGTGGTSETSKLRGSAGGPRQGRLRIAALMNARCSSTETTSAVRAPERLAAHAAMARPQPEAEPCSPAEPEL